jgi:asparaginyl-tRNA synthetase
LTDFFSSRSFLQTHPPIITSSDCEGAGEVFTVTTGKAEAKAKTGKTEGVHHEARTEGQAIETPDSFFSDPKYLTVSSQLHLEALAQSVGNVWTLSPTFRAEKSDTSRHMAEFYMLEAEMSFVDDMALLMDLVEDMLRYLVSKLRQETTIYDDIVAASGSRTMEKNMLSSADEVKARWDGIMARPWPRIRYTDAIDLLKENESIFTHKVEWGANLQGEHERFIAKTVAGGQGSSLRTPVFVTHYPRDIKAFYMPEASWAKDDTGSNRPEPGPVVACFDLLVPDLCEIVGGSMREHRLNTLLLNMVRKGLVAPEASTSARRKKSDPLEWYVDLRRWGSPPHGGFGLGFDRLLAYLTGVQNVKDVVAFPRWWGRCDC